MRGSWVLALAISLVVLGVSAPAKASPITYGFDSGSVTLFATVGGSELVSATTFDMTGVQVTVDTAYDQLVSLDFTADPVVLGLNSSYAGVDTINIDSFELTASGAPGSMALVDPGPPSIYQFTVGPAQLDLVVSSPDDAAFGGPTSTTPPLVTGSLNLDQLAGVLSMDGITLGVIGPYGSETAPIVLQADLLFTGIEEASGSGGPGPIPTPEPSGVLLFAVGTLIVAGGIRRRV